MTCITRTALLVAALLSIPAVATADVKADPTAIEKALRDFSGSVIVAKGNQVIWSTATDRTECPKNDRITATCQQKSLADVEWPWASVTKQVVATLVMQQVERGRLMLDSPAQSYLSGWDGPATVPTIRQLLQHRAGLRNPNDSVADKSGAPSFYTTGPNGVAWCLTGRGAPGGNWQYNNCDYIVLGAVLERVSGMDIGRLFAKSIARPLKLKHARFVERDDTVPRLASGSVEELAPYGAAGALVGTPSELLAFDRALLHAKLLKPASRTEMWKGDPTLGFMALGQWSFDAKPKGCAASVHIIERRGGIGRTQVRNILLPDSDISVIMFISDPDFDFGEIWQGKGLSHDVLAATVCAS